MRVFVMLVCIVSGVASAAPLAAEKQWSVAEPDAQAQPVDVVLSLDRGTWMSLSVSPDGRTIAFDLLGDIYTLPIDGGTARNIASGLAWDMQPAFSPDGRRIAFTSDRAGGDNIWLMDADGSDARAITSESFRLLNSPAFSPDGRFLVARKHFTTSRSLGTGELWLYDLRGGNGVPLVERPNKRYQKELGEPAFAADGLSVFYSQNATPGDEFIYAEDSNQEIFQIKQWHLAEGRSAVVAGGPGGAVRPTPSPDGRWLAFVRRVRAKSRLFLQDLRSGTEFMIVDELDQDMQEIWAVQGLYPTMAWLPNSRTLLFWRDGRIWRADLLRGEDRKAPLSASVREIRFTIEDQRRVYPAPRPQVAVAPEVFDTRMVRWATPVPGSDVIVFESIGRLYRKAGADAEPRRLTTDKEDRFELYPTPSPDGRWIYFVTWQDDKLGSIRRVRSGGGRSMLLSREPGHYRELSVSPDGEQLLTRRAEGGGLMSPEQGSAPGIYRLPSKGGAATLVTREGTQAHFADRDDRIYLIRDKPAKDSAQDPQDVRQLVSVTLDGHDPKPLAQSRLAIDMRVSPAGDYLLFREQYHIFLTPLPRTGQPLEVGPAEESLPLVRLSSIGGEYAGFAGSERAYWSIGPTWKSVDIATAFAGDYQAPEQGIDLSRQVAAAAPEGTVLLTNARILPLRRQGAIADQVIERGSILIQNNRIARIGARIEAPPGANVLDLNGKTVIPGLLDVHAHGPYAQDLVVPQQNWSALGHLALGVTTVHNPSSVASEVFAAAELARAGSILAPRIFSSGEIVYGARGSRYALIDSYTDALAHVRRLKAQGAISIKNYNQPRREQRQQIVAAARAEQMLVVAEGGALFHMDMSLIADGNSGIEHTLPQQAIYADVISFWRQTNVGFTPTLGVAFGGIAGEDYWYDRTEVWKHPLLSHYVPPKLLQARAVRRQKAPAADYGHFANARSARQLADAGVLVNIGGHGQREGLAAHWEIWMLVQGGMSPGDALRAATIVPAAYLGMDRDLGSIEPGKLADLLVIDGNPLEDIRTTDNLTHVMLNGRLYELPSLNETLTGNRVRAPFYWEGLAESEIR